MRKKLLTELLLFSLLPLLLHGKIKTADLKSVMPSADSFRERKEPLPCHEAYKKDKLIGLCFLSTGVLTNSRGYNGPLVILIGIKTNGTLSGIKILKHRENVRQARIIEKKEFGSRYKDKKITDAFEPGADAENITGATITAKSVARIVKESSRRVHELFFSKTPSVKGSEPAAGEQESYRPKHGITKIDKKTIRSRNLSEKEAEYYEKK